MAQWFFKGHRYSLELRGSFDHLERHVLLQTNPDHLVGPTGGSGDIRNVKVLDLNPGGMIRKEGNGAGIHLIDGIRRVIGIIIHGQNGILHGEI